jgi:hypothetical protein
VVVEFLLKRRGIIDEFDKYISRARSNVKKQARHLVNSSPKHFS